MLALEENTRRTSSRNGKHASFCRIANASKSRLAAGLNRKTGCTKSILPSNIAADTSYIFQINSLLTAREHVSVEREELTNVRGL